MGASKRKQIVNGHAKSYVDAVFAERLREEGFVNLEDRSLCQDRGRFSVLAAKHS